MSSSSTTSSPPPLKLIARSKKAVELYELPTPSSPETKRHVLSPSSSTFHSLTADGSRVLIHVPSVGIIVRDLMTEGEVDGPPVSFLQGSEKVQCGYWSPRGTYIVTWERPIKSVDGNAPPPNLKIWSGADGSFLRGFHSKPFPKKLSSQNQQQSSAVQWSPLQWSPDESSLFHGVANEIHVYPGGVTAEMRYASKINVPNMSLFSVSPTHLITFTPEIKSGPARVSLHQHHPEHIANISSKSFYQTEECSFLWSPQGTSCLILTQTTVDTTGESYYGSSNLYLVTTSAVTPVPLPNKSQNALIHDVAWNPHPTKPNCFALISGKMPAMISLHRGDNAQPSFLFGEYHRNVISWSPHGRFVAFGGFGNLAGNVDIWDKNKAKICGSFSSGTAAVGWGWGADSRVFGVSVTSPRMNVENGVTVFRYAGDKVWDDGKVYAPDKLLQSEFVPRLWGVYEDRPQSPERMRQTLDEKNEKKGAEEVKKTAYVPPAARRAGGRPGNTLAERMRKEKEQSTAGAMRVTKNNSGSIPGASVKKVVGMGATSEKSKSAKARERQKAAKARKEEEEKRLKELKEEQEKKKEREEKEKKVEGAKEDPEKRAKKIKKTLKQIKELKAKDKKELNDDQLKKIDMEEGLIKELEGLGL